MQTNELPSNDDVIKACTIAIDRISMMLLDDNTDETRRFLQTEALRKLRGHRAQAQQPA